MLASRELFFFVCCTQSRLNSSAFGMSTLSFLRCENCDLGGWREGSGFVFGADGDVPVHIFPENCLCLSGVSLMDEDYYPEALALTPPPFVDDDEDDDDDMSALRNEAEVLAELSRASAKGRATVSSVGFLDGAGWPSSMFDQGQLPVFGGVTDDLTSDKHWLLYGKTFLDSYQPEMSIVILAVKRAIDGDDTVIDWSGEGAYVTTLVASSLRSVSQFFYGVSENTMYGIITGLERDLRVVIKAEGQMIRCMISASDNETRSTFYAMWVACILRLGGASLLETCQSIFSTIGRLCSEAGECGVNERMRAAYFRASNYNRSLGIRWDMLMEEVFRLRANLLCGTEFDVDFCGMHPPMQCPLGALHSVVPDHMTENVVDFGFVNSPASSCTLASDDDEDGDESESEEEERGVVPHSYVTTHVPRLPGKGVGTAGSRVVVASGSSSPVMHRRLGV